MIFRQCMRCFRDGTKFGLHIVMGKLFLFVLLCCVLCTDTNAQDKYTKCRYHYFSNGKISTSQCYDPDNRWGMAKAFNASGGTIYEKELRHIAGNSSVEFSYYDNGAVQIARWHSAPDAGIQWYNTTTYFTRDGHVDREEENNYDDAPHVRMTLTKPVETPPQPKQEVASCGAIYVTEFWYINRTKYPVGVSAIRKSIPPEVKTSNVYPGDTVKGGDFIMTEQFVDPGDYFDFRVKYLKHGKKDFNLVFYQFSNKTVTKNIKKYYYLIR